MNNNLPEPELLAEARASVATAISITGRQVSRNMELDAGSMLAAIWTESARWGVAPEDWAAVTALPMSCLDVLAAVERRPHS